MSTGLPRPADCRACHDPIRFVELPSGKPVPVNPMPAVQGRGTIAARLVMTAKGKALRGFYVTQTRGPSAAYPLRFTPHHATCEAAQRPATKTTPAPADVPLF